MSTTATTTAESESHAPLLHPRQEAPRAASLAMLLGRVTGRRGPSMLVRETAALELEERRADWGYSKPVVALDMVWNTAFVVVSITMLILSVKEKPNTPIRIWICGYALQCLVHVVLVWIEYRRRNSRRVRDEERQQQQQQQAEVEGQHEENEGENVDSEDEDGVDRASVTSNRSSDPRNLHLG